MEPSEVFFSLTKHLISCTIPCMACETCAKVFGEQRPKALLIVQFEDAVKRKHKRDDATPKEDE